MTLSSQLKQSFAGIKSDGKIYIYFHQMALCFFYFNTDLKSMLCFCQHCLNFCPHKYLHCCLSFNQFLVFSLDWFYDGMGVEYLQSDLPSVKLCIPKPPQPQLRDDIDVQSKQARGVREQGSAVSQLLSDPETPRGSHHIGTLQTSLPRIFQNFALELTQGHHNPEANSRKNLFLGQGGTEPRGDKRLNTCH